MRYQTTPAFDRDLGCLRAREKELFTQSVREKFIPAAERRAADPATPWPRSLRVRDVKGAAGVWEMTWSLGGPDGRATWEWVTVADEPAIRWRRVGSHAVFAEP